MACANENKFDYAGSDVYRFRTTIDVGSISYSDNDCVGGTITIPDVFGCADYSNLVGIQVYEKKGTTGAVIMGVMRAYLLNRNVAVADSATFGLTGNSVLPTDIEFSGSIRGWDTIETDYAKADLVQNISGSREGIKGFGHVVKAGTGSKDLYLILQNKSGASMDFAANAKLYVIMDFLRH